MAGIKLQLVFGLISIPVKASTAGRTENISFNMLSACCNARTNQKLVCSTCQKEVERGKTNKGYEFAKGQYVTVTEAELKAFEPEASKILDIESTVDPSEVDPMLFDKSWYLEPEGPGKQAYNLLLHGLIAEGRYGIAHVTMNSREHVVIIRPYQGRVLAMHTMFYEDEVNAIPSMGLDSVKLREEELQLARKLLQIKAADFEHGRYSDGYKAQVSALLQSKQEGKVYTMPSAKTAPKDTTGDLMAMLAASLKDAPPKERRKKTA